MENCKVSTAFIGLITVGSLRLQHFTECSSVHRENSVSGNVYWRRKAVMTLVDRADHQVMAKFEREYDRGSDKDIVDDLKRIAKEGF